MISIMPVFCLNSPLATMRRTNLSDGGRKMKEALTTQSGSAGKTPDCDA
jgi:hypothetical protein